LHRTRQKADRVQTWVLVVSAFALGVLLGVAAFVGVWRTTASRGDRADAARAVVARHLHDARARSATLSTKLHKTKVDLAATVRQKKHLAVELRDATGQVAASSQQAASARTQLLTIQHRASSVTSYVASLDAYVKNTPSQDLDSAFLQSQLVYLSAAVHRLQAP
jgi:septal ring factor EnvC (AmiA/AmiB activator)